MQTGNQIAVSYYFQKKDSESVHGCKDDIKRANFLIEKFKYKCRNSEIDDLTKRSKFWN